MVGFWLATDKILRASTALFAIMALALEFTTIKIQLSRGQIITRLKHFGFTTLLPFFGLYYPAFYSGWALRLLWPRSTDTQATSFSNASLNDL